MIHKKVTHQICWVSLIISTATAFTQCRPNVSIEHEQATSKVGVDTLIITASNIDRDNSLRPTDWKAYNDGRETLIAPSSWISHIDGIKLIISPQKSVDSSEHLIFTRYRKDSSTLNDDKIAQQLVDKAFNAFPTLENDKLKKVQLTENFFYERTADLLKQGDRYKGYCMIYVSDSLVYDYTVTLTQARLKAYEGDLIKDMVGNLQINLKYVMRDSNPVKKIIYLKP